jgi:arsenate reductase
MAEGLLNAHFRDKYEAYSAGVVHTNVNPYAVEVMKEIGIDISTYRSKSIEEFRNKKFDIVVTV